MLYLFWMHWKHKGEINVMLSFISLHWVNERVVSGFLVEIFAIALPTPFGMGIFHRLLEHVHGISWLSFSLPKLT